MRVNNGKDPSYRIKQHPNGKWYIEKKFTEEQLEEIENSIMGTIDANLNYMVKSNRVDLSKMLIDSLQNRIVNNN